MAILWSTATVLFLSFLASYTIALPGPLLRAKLRRVIESRELCYDDDVLWSFQYWSHDSTPYCSSLLGIQDYTTTVDPVMSYTTINTLVTTEYDDPTDTVTVPQVTVFSTTTTIVAHVWGKRRAKRQLSCSGDNNCAKFTEVDVPIDNFTEVAIPFPPPSPIVVIATAPVPVPLSYTEPAPPYPKSPPPTLIAPAPFPSLVSANPGPRPITDNPVPSILADCATNASIASFVFSACSCLRLKPKTVAVTPTVQTTRTISGIDYEAQPTVAGGTTTIIVTQTLLPPVGPPVLNNTFPGTSVTSGSIGNPNFSRPGRGGQPGSPSFLSTAVTAPSGGIISPVLPPFPPPHSLLFPTGTGIVGPPVIFTSSSGFVPYPTATGGPLITFILSSGTGAVVPYPTGINQPEKSSTTFPTYVPLHSTFIAPPPMTPPLPLSSSSPAPPDFSLAGGNRIDFDVSSSLSSFPSNTTKLVIGTAIAPTIESLSLSVSAVSSFVSIEVITDPPFSHSTQSSSLVSISSLIVRPNTTTKALLNATIALNGAANPSSGLLAIGNSIGPSSCPKINNTIYTDNSTVPSQQYQIQCYRQYTGPSYLGLAEPNFKSCIEECDKVNIGFSELECYGVTWLEYSGGAESVRCLLKTQQGLEDFLTNMVSVSAVLLDVQPPILGIFYPPPREVNGVWYPA